jgi:hypothetical protein
METATTGGRVARRRERLKVRREPHWQRLAEGAYLGFRRGPDTWIARYRGRDGKQQYNSLGEHPEFDDAKREAREWLTQIAGTSVRTVTRATIKAALTAYLTDLRRHGRAKTAKAAEGMFATAISNDPLAAKALETATRDDFEEWRDRLTKGRQPRSVNRYVRQIMAALNRAIELGHVGNPAAWKLTRRDSYQTRCPVRRTAHGMSTRRDRRMPTAPKSDPDVDALLDMSEEELMGAALPVAAKAAPPAA